MKSFSFCVLAVMFLQVRNGTAQDLDPRAYVWVPKNITILVAGYSYSQGGVITDPSLPVDNIKAKIHMGSFALGRTLHLLGKSAQITAAVPFAWADVSGDVGTARQQVARTGFADMRVRFSILLHGAPAATAAEIATATRRTIIGTSLTVSAPIGEYFNDKLINIGTNRWAFKPELAISHPFGARWLLDAYAGVWLFAKNNSFYPGVSERTQDPLMAYQAHLSYNIQPRLWGALNLTFYTGGGSTVNGVEKDDAQSNSRIGGTLVFPFRKKQSIKIAFSRGAIVRYGANFSMVSVGWQNSYFRKPKS